MPCRFKLVCSLCNKEFKTLYLSHAFQHSKQVNFEIVCGVKNCNSVSNTFRTSIALTQHLNRVDKEILDETNLNVSRQIVCFCLCNENYDFLEIKSFQTHYIKHCSKVNSRLNCLFDLKAVFMNQTVLMVLNCI